MMTLKSVSKSGKPVAMGAEESLAKAVLMAVSKREDDSFIYWAIEETMKRTSLNVQKTDQKDVWLASAEGTVMVGRTHKGSDKFYEPKEWKFKIVYSNTVDNFGLPTLLIKSADVAPVAVVNAADASDPESDQV